MIDSTKKMSWDAAGDNTHTGGQHFPSRPSPIRFLFPLHLTSFLFYHPP